MTALEASREKDQAAGRAGRILPKEIRGWFGLGFEMRSATNLRMKLVADSFLGGLWMVLERASRSMRN